MFQGFYLYFMVATWSVWFCTIYNKMMQVFALADDIDVMARRKADLENVCVEMRNAGKEMALGINTTETK